MELNLEEKIYTDVINPVDFCNRYKIQEVFNLIISTIKNVKKTSINSFTYVENKADESKQMIFIEDGNFIAKIENGLRMSVGKPYTAFMMLQKYIFKDNFLKTLHHVIYEYMNNDMEYIRVGVKYYKLISKTDNFGIVRNEIKLWDKAIISQDLGKRYLEDIPKFDDFTMEPNNKEYRSIIGNNYNLYSPFNHEVWGGDNFHIDKWPWINTMVSHIFGDQYDLGLRYLKILYEKPKQILPILVLTSTERQTGKTTFIDFLNILFGANMVIVNPQDISNSFNGSYADKNIIAIEESRFENAQAVEKLKNLSTQKKILVNTKHVAHYSVPFYGKLIITSNDEEKFSKVDDTEIRYWVRKVPSLVGQGNHNILEDMQSEIPYFLRYLTEMDPVDYSKSRMVFTKEEIQTDALSTVKKESLPTLHKDLEILLDEFCSENTETKEVMFTASDVKDRFFKSNNNYSISYIRNILKTSMKLEKSKNNIRYIPFENEANRSRNKKQGRPFYFLNKYNDELNLQ